jgi:hypothetical protein
LTPLAEWATKHELVDIHELMHPQDEPVTTYIGTAKIDYIFVSRDIIPT